MAGTRLAALAGTCSDALMAAFSDYGSYDALGLAELVAKGEVEPRELVDCALTRITRVNPQLNAVVFRMDEEAQRVASGELPKGPFTGVPFLLKDLRARYAGVPLSEGSRYFKDFVPDHDSELVARYRRAGLVVVGKTNTPELGLLPVTENELFGDTHTPWKLGHTSGGSSGGSAAAVAAGVVPAAHASDGGGSIRIPASCCGVVGFKPTRGRTPMGPDDSEAWHGCSAEHVVSRSVRDSAALLDATQGPEPGAPYHAPPLERPLLEEVGRSPGRLRIAFTSQPPLPASVHPDCVAAVESTAKLCEELGHEVTQASVPLDPESFALHYSVLVCAATAAHVARAPALVGREPERHEIQSSTWLVSMLGKQFSAEQLSVAIQELQAMSRKAATFFQSYDVLLTPTLAKPPVRIGELLPTGLEAKLQELVAQRNIKSFLKLPGVVERASRRLFAFMPFTPLANVAGLPSVSLPLTLNADRLPIGSLFTARFGDDASLFRLAAQLESARPWKDQRPRLHAFDPA